jgi:hypothetical protein
LAAFVRVLLISVVWYAMLVVPLWTWLAMLVIGGLHSELTPGLPAVGYWQALPVGVIATLVMGALGGLDGQRQDRLDAQSVETQTLQRVNRLWAEILATTPDREAAAQRFSGELGALLALREFQSTRS